MKIDIEHAGSSVHHDGRTLSFAMHSEGRTVTSTATHHPAKTDETLREFVVVTVTASEKGTETPEDHFQTAASEAQLFLEPAQARGILKALQALKNDGKL